MLGIILVRNRASDAAFERSLEAVKSTGLANLTIVSDTAVAGMRSITGPFSAAIIADEMTANGASRTVMVDARLAPSNSQLRSAIGAISRGRSGPVNYIPIRRNCKQVDISALKASNLVEFLANSPDWPIMIVGLDPTLIENIRTMQCNSSTELLASLMAVCSVNDQIVSAAGAAIELGSGFDDNSTLSLSGNGMSGLLQNMLNLCAIEEMFPAHPWEHFEAESGAAAYHSLAALFLRCGDSETALSCLTLSDSLEDSPRSLALRALIHEQKGEIVGAVTNMVASLQAYESRKANDGSHYLSFNPMNAELLSNDLQHGLTALNNADNEQAYRYFSKAVVAFDPLLKSAGFGR